MFLITFCFGRLFISAVLEHIVDFPGPTDPSDRCSDSTIEKSSWACRVHQPAARIRLKPGSCCLEAMTMTMITRPVSSSHTSLCLALMCLGPVPQLSRCSHHARSCLGGVPAQARATWNEVEVMHAVLSKPKTLLHNRRVLTRVRVARMWRE